MEDKKDDDEISIDARKSKSSDTPENSDEEFLIDLSKIKGFFKKKREEHKVHEAMENKEETHAHHAMEAGKGEARHEEHKAQGQKDDDDEINIDFSKIKNIFKAKKSDGNEEKGHRGETVYEKKDDDEISIDFSKLKNIKNIFKKEGKEAQDDDISLDLGKIKDFFIKHRVLLLLLIPIFLSIFLRVQPAYLPITDQWAADSVINSIRSQISSQISQQYPNLPDQNKNALVENELQKVLREQKAQIDPQIADTSNAFKSRLQDDSGQTYLVAIDPYFWTRHARNILNNGHPGDELKDGQPWDNHMYAPGGRGIPVDMFHAYFIAYLFKFLSFFNRDLGIMTVAFFTPVLISALSVIPAFFITKKVVGNFGAFFAAAIVAIHPSFLTRTVGGFADTDAYNVMFPLFIAWLFLEALEAKKTRNIVILSVVNGLLVGLYSVTWGGWWYIFDFIIASTVLYVAYYSFVHRDDIIRNLRGFVRQKAIKNSLTFLAVFFVVSALSITLFVNYGHFTKFAKNPGGFAKLKEVGITTIWPNVFTTVAEQNPASLNNVIDQVGLGGKQIVGFPIFFLLSLTGIAITLATGKKKLWFIIGTFAWFLAILAFNIDSLNLFLVLISIPIAIRLAIALWESDTEIDIKYAIFLIFWFIATIYASTKGVRFTLLAAPIFAIGLGISLGKIYKFANVWIAKLLQVNKIVSKTTIMIALLLLLITPYNSALSTAKNEIPSFNDAWRVSLEKIKDDSKPNAIINSWWDFGHWFKYWADRAVTFDGTSQNTPQAHWIGKVLLTDNEKLAAGILRMLDCSGGSVSGGTTAFESINKKLNDGTNAISLLKEIIVEDNKAAGGILREKFSDEEAEEILSQTHCQPPENYFITSEDMVGKSGVWAHFGSWDFDRALIYNTLKKKEYQNNLGKSVEFLQQRFNYSQKDAENMYYEVQSITSSDQANSWIAPWPGYAGTAGCSRLDNETFGCNIANIPLIINPKTHEVYAESTSGKLYPQKVSFQEDDGIMVKQYDESTIQLGNGRHLGIALIKEGESYRAVAMDSDLTASMFTRMFYQDGAGLKYFRKFSDESSVFGNRIIVWKVDWEGKSDVAAAEESAEPGPISKDEEPINETNASQDIL